MRLSRTADVDREFEGLGGVLGKVFRRGVGSLLEAGGMVAGEHRRFDEKHFLQLKALAQRLGVVDDGDRIFFVDQPQAGDSVSLDKDDKGVETGLFEAGGVEEREVEARSDLVR